MKGTCHYTGKTLQTGILNLASPHCLVSSNYPSATSQQSTSSPPTPSHFDNAFVNTLRGIHGFKATLRCMKHRVTEQNPAPVTPQPSLCHCSTSSSVQLAPVQASLCEPWGHRARLEPPPANPTQQLLGVRLGFIAHFQTSNSHPCCDHQQLHPHTCGCASSQPAENHIHGEQHTINSTGQQERSKPLAQPQRRGLCFLLALRKGSTQNHFLVYGPFSACGAGHWHLPAGIFSGTETTRGTDKLLPLPCAPDKLRMRSLPRYKRWCQLQIRVNMALSNGTSETAEHLREDISSLLKTLLISLNQRTSSASSVTKIIHLPQAHSEIKRIASGMSRTSSGGNFWCWFEGDRVAACPRLLQM